MADNPLIKDQKEEQEYQTKHNIFFTSITNLVNKIFNSTDSLIENEDLARYSCSHLQTPHIVEQVNQYQKNNGYSSLSHLLIRLNWKHYVIGLAYSLGQNLAGCLGIFFLDKITNYLKQDSMDSVSKWWFIILISSLFLCFFIKTILFSQTKWVRTNHNATQQAQLRYLILRKSLRIHQFCDSRDHGMKVDVSNLMSTDAKDSSNIIFGVVEIINSSITLTIILYYIYTKLGSAIYYGLIVLFISLLLNTFIHRTITIFKALTNNLKIEESSDIDSTIFIKIQNTRFRWARLNQTKSENRKGQESVELQQSSLISKSEYRSSSDRVFSLQIRDLTIHKASLNIIIGEIGSGKTALLLSLLNELENEALENAKYENENKKTVQINGSIGYVSQNNWLQSRSIRENILFGEEYHEEWYQKCISACQLNEDLAQFTESDLKMIGPGGSNLSGGQRQRISLCRAIYQKKQIYLLDDVFSSLDTHVAKKVYTEAIIGLLNTQLASTVLLVTSHYAFIDLSHQSINLIYLQNGCISNDTNEVNSYFMQSLQKYGSSNLEQNLHKNTIQSLDQIMSPLINTNRLDQTVKKVTQSVNPNKILGIQVKKLVKNIPQIKKKSNDEERQKGNINMKTMMLFFKSRGFIFTVLHLLFRFITQGSQMLIDFWLRDYSKNGEGESFIQEFLNKFFDGFNQIFQALTIINLVIALVCGMIYAMSSIKSSKYIFHRLNNSLILSKMSFFDTNPIGRIISRVSSDQFKVDDVLSSHYHILLEKLAYLIGYPIGMMIQFPWTGFHFSVIIVACYWLSLRYRSASREVIRLNQVNQGLVLTTITENAQGLTLIRGMGKNEFAIKDFLSQTDKYISSQVVSDAISVWFVIRLFMLSNSSFLLIVLSNIYLILADVDINPNTVALGLIYSMLFSTVFSDVMFYFNYFEQDMISLERISQYLENEQEELNKKEVLHRKEDGNKKDMVFQQDSTFDLQEIDSTSCICFKNVYLKYGRQSSNTGDDNFALKNVSLNIKKGERVAFCGRTGSGKTSILNVLFRLYDISSGEILINQNSYQSYSLKDLRNQISIIPQYGFLYNSSMYENLVPNKEKSKEEISRVLNRFDSLRIMKQESSIDERGKGSSQSDNETISSETTLSAMSSMQSTIQDKSQNQGNILDMRIQEGGKNLSNGEKITLRDTSILCLDEATSNMDPKTDQILHEELFKFSEGKTLIVITHRLENISMYDRVFVMDSGEIVESGHVSELAKNTDGFFNRIYQQQQYQQQQ